MIIRVLFCVSLFCISQNLSAQNHISPEENEQRVKAIPMEIDSAVQDKNYQDAAFLKEELDIRKKLQVAYNNKNERRIDELKDDIEDCDCIVGYNAKVEQSNDEQFVFEGAMTQNQKENLYRKKGFVKYFIFSPFSYLQSATRQESYYWIYDYTTGISTQIYQPIEDFLSLVGGGFRFGGTVFFDDMKKNQKFRVGFDVMFVSFTAGLNLTRTTHGEALYFSIGQPGVALKYYLNNYSGLNFRLNLGSAFGFSSGISGVGIGFQGRLSYWHKNFSVGVEYQLLGSDKGTIDPMGITNNDGRIRINQIGLTCGFQF